jgi:hypothetical protein
VTVPPRRRVAAAFTAIIALALVTGSCASGDAAAVSASLESAPRTAAPELPDELQDALPPGVSIPDVSIPDDVPGAAELQECVDLTAAYAEVIVLALSGDDQGQLPVLFDQLEAAAPEDVQDDLAVVRRTATEAAGGGLIDATGALLDQEYIDANNAVLDWLATACAGEGG